MVVKKLKKKPKKMIKQKQSQSQKQNVNQIVRIYLDERRKARRKKTAPKKNLKGSNIPNINISPIFQNPINDMYPLQQLYNPSIFSRRGYQQPVRIQDPVVNPTPVRNPQVPIVNPTPSSPVARQQPIIPPSIDVATNPLVAPRTPVNDFPNLQGELTPSIKTVITQENSNPNSDATSIISGSNISSLGYSSEEEDFATFFQRQQEFNKPTTTSTGVNTNRPATTSTGVNPLVTPRTPVNDFPNLQGGSNISSLRYSSEEEDFANKPSTFRIADIRKPSPDPVPSINRPLQVPLPFYTQDPVEDQLAMDFNMGLGYSSLERPTQTKFELLGEEFYTDEEKAIVSRYDALRGNTRGRRPQTIEGYKKGIERYEKLKKSDQGLYREGKTRNQTAELITSPVPFKTGIGEREKTQMGKSPVIQKRKEFEGRNLFKS